MADPRNSDLRELLPQLTAEAARELAREEDAEGDARKRRARALFAYAEALDGGVASTPAEITPAPAHGTSSASATVTTGGNGDMGGGSGPSADQPGGRAKPAAPPSNKRPLIWAAIEDAPLPGWSAARVREVLVQRELIPAETTKASIGVTLRRMYLDHEIAKTPDGLYTTPEHGQLHEDEDSEAPSNPFLDSGPDRGEGPTLSFRGAQPTPDPRIAMR